MPLEVACPSCEAKFRVPEAAAGKKIRCPKCKGAMEVPAETTRAAASFQAPAAGDESAQPGSVASDAPTVFIQRPSKQKSPAPVAEPLKPPAPLPPPSVPPPKNPASGPWRTESAHEKPEPPAEIAPPAPPADDWTLRTADGEIYGPVTRSELDAWKEEGRITADCQLQQPGDAAWIAAAEIFPDLIEQESEPEQPPQPEEREEAEPDEPEPVAPPAPVAPPSAPRGKRSASRPGARPAPSIEDEPDYSRSSRSKAIAGILGIFLAPFGIHRFYLGYWGIGLAMLFTGGGCGVWSMVDAVLVLLGKVPDADGRPLSD